MNESIKKKSCEGEKASINYCWL